MMKKILNKFIKQEKVNVAIVGASGLIGQRFVQVLEERSFPVGRLYLFASNKSAGQEILFNNKNYLINELTERTFNEIKADIALFSAGANISKKFAPLASCTGCIVIDNSSAWRMDKTVPLVIPEVNPKDAFKHKGIIANPNCSTIQALVALKPLHNIFKIKRVVISTYQAVSGAGNQGIEDLENGINNIAPKKFRYPIFNNCIPQIDIFNDLGYTKEEIKLVNETKKIFHETIKITATAVRVPIKNCHCESINVEFEKHFDMGQVIEILENAPSVRLLNNINESEYPMPINTEGQDSVYVGRLRRDFTVDSGLNLWVVADNTRKGAATNAIQIAELLYKNNLYRNNNNHNS